MTWQQQSGSAAKYRTAEHRRERAKMLKAFRPGDPCCLCGHAMYPPTSALHADHDPTGTYYRGLAHGTDPCETCGVRCNVVDGSRRGRARQGKPRRWEL